MGQTSRVRATSLPQNRLDASMEVLHDGIQFSLSHPRRASMPFVLSSKYRCQSLLPSLLLVLVFSSCDRSTDPVGPRFLETREVTVGPTLARCYGVGEQSCMVVDGEFFYDGIEGFEYEAGYNYRLRIGKYDPWDGENLRRMPAGMPIACWSNWRRPRRHPRRQPCR